jgi:F420H(2)-dependent quinone reductase
MAASVLRRPPRWLTFFNRINVVLLRHGIGPGPQRLLSVPGRATGRRRTTPVAIVSVAGERCLVAGYETSDWIKNARAAGWGVIGRGKTCVRVALTEMPIEATPSILREFAREVPGSRSFLTVGAGASDADFAEACRHHPVFRLN